MNGMNAIEIIQQKIAECVDRLNDVSTHDDNNSELKDDSNGVDNGNTTTKRTRKRIMQKLGKLKKELQQQEQLLKDTNKTDNEANNDILVKEMESKALDVPVQKSRKELKVKLRILNQEIAEFAQKKQLSLAIKRFNWGRKKGIPIDIHTFANLLNAYIRCGELDEIHHYLQLMASYDIQPNTIICTILIKGYCESGQIKLARNIIFQHCHRAECGMNIRTLNTFLRGCNRIGAIHSALEILRYYNRTTLQRTPSMTTDQEDLHLNATSYENLIGLLSRNFDFSNMHHLIQLILNPNDDVIMKSGHDPMDNAVIYYQLALSYAILGHLDEATRWLDLTLSTIQRNESNQLIHAMKQHSSSSNPTTIHPVPSKSVQLFLDHRYDEVTHDSEALHHYIKSLQLPIHEAIHIHYQLSDQPQWIPNLDRDQSRWITCLIQYFSALSQLLYFGYDNQSDYDDYLDPVDPSNVHPIHLVDRMDPMKLHETNPQIKKQKRDQSMSPSQQMATLLSYKSRDISTVQRESETTLEVEKLIYALRDKFGLSSIFKCFLAEMERHEDGKARKGIMTSTATAITTPTATLSTTPTTTVTPQQSSLLCRELCWKLREEVVQKLVRIMDNEPSNTIDFHELFRPLGSFTIHKGGEAVNDLPWSSQESLINDDPTIPIKLEIGCGNGEWIVAQAKHDMTTTPLLSPSPPHEEDGPHTGIDPPLPRNHLYPTVTAYWIGLELRCDRVHKILCNQLIHYTSVTTSFRVVVPPNNLAIIGGDASKIIPTRFPSHSIASVFVNHPQPPDHIVASNKRSQGKHLYTASFLKELHRILIDDGTVTLVTDSLPYIKLIVETCANELMLKMGCGFQSVSSSVNQSQEGLEREVSSRSVQEVVPISIPSHMKKVGSSSMNDQGRAEDPPRIVIWRGSPGKKEGHAVDSSSYFDRMWKKGAKTRRWFVHLRKLILIDDVNAEKEER